MGGDDDWRGVAIGISASAVDSLIGFIREIVSGVD
jgi:hypothetical protein